MTSEQRAEKFNAKLDVLARFIGSGGRPALTAEALELERAEFMRRRLKRIDPG